MGIPSEVKKVPGGKRYIIFLGPYRTFFVLGCPNYKRKIHGRKRTYK